MSLAPWGVLAGGKLCSNEEEDRRTQSSDVGRAFAGTKWRRNKKERTMSAALNEVAKEVGAKRVIAVAIVRGMQKAPYLFPVVGSRKMEQLEAMLKRSRSSSPPSASSILNAFFPLILVFQSHSLSVPLSGLIGSV